MICSTSRRSASFSRWWWRGSTVGLRSNRIVATRAGSPTGPTARAARAARWPRWASLRSSRACRWSSRWTARALAADRGNQSAAVSDWTGALAEYDRAVTLDPTLQLYHAERATALARLGHVDAARDELSGVIAQEPLALHWCRCRGSTRKPVTALRPWTCGLRRRARARGSRHCTERRRRRGSLRGNRAGR